MKMNKQLLVVAIGLIVCVVVLLPSTSIQGSGTYEIKPKITIPAQKTDTARVIDAYERLMDKFITANERNLNNINIDVKEVLRKLESIDRNLITLSSRIATIEKALGIERAKPATTEQKPKAKESPGLSER